MLYHLLLLIASSGIAFGGDLIPAHSLALTHVLLLQ